MKVKINKAFTDKYTGEAYKVGQVVEVTETRAKELLGDARKLVDLVEEKPKAEDKAKPKATAKKTKKK